MQHDKHYIECSKCGGISSIINIPSIFLSTQIVFGHGESKEVEDIAGKESRQWKKPSDIRGNTIKRESILGFEMFGKLPLHVRILMYGKYGSGKSSLALKLMEAISMSPWRGMGAYACVEEGSESATMQQKLNDQQIESDQMIFVDTVDDVFEAIEDGTIKNAVIDSMQRAKVNIDQATELYTVIPGILILIAHSTKQNDYKGESGFGHDCDIVAKMEDGFLKFEKNRFGTPAKTYRIWGEDDG